MPQIRPIKDLRNTTEISSLCHQLKEPVFITKNGYGDLVLMSMETYEKKMAQIELYQKLGEAEIQLKSGKKLADGEEVLNRLREKYCGK
ncbi:hypothetical protein [Halomonas sp.]|uniref:type II toxin-antitoxin system Phd/YefM family antitoxin n=1 Tax=Halomonas sp. TaxID=1486246 RepID=UPI0025B80A7E|nr:hypothetical protein [Halomonas sp.]